MKNFSIIFLKEAPTTANPFIPTNLQPIQAPRRSYIYVYVWRGPVGFFSPGKIVVLKNCKTWYEKNSRIFPKRPPTPANPFIPTILQPIQAPRRSYVYVYVWRGPVGFFSPGKTVRLKHWKTLYEKFSIIFLKKVPDPCKPFYTNQSSTNQSPPPVICICICVEGSGLVLFSRKNSCLKKL